MRWSSQATSSSLSLSRSAFVRMTRLGSVFLLVYFIIIPASLAFSPSHTLNHVFSRAAGHAQRTLNSQSRKVRRVFKDVSLVMNSLHISQTRTHRSPSLQKRDSHNQAQCRLSAFPAGHPLPPSATSPVSASHSSAPKTQTRTSKPSSTPSSSNPSGSSSNYKIVHSYVCSKELPQISTHSCPI